MINVLVWWMGAKLPAVHVPRQTIVIVGRVLISRTLMRGNSAALAVTATVGLRLERALRLVVTFTRPSAYPVTFMVTIVSLHQPPLNWRAGN